MDVPLLADQQEVIDRMTDRHTEEPKLHDQLATYGKNCSYCFVKASRVSIRDILANTLATSTSFCSYRKKKILSYKT